MNTYTVSSGFPKINNFVTIYTITGGLDSIRSSSDLIISTTTKDIDSNVNVSSRAQNNKRTGTTSSRTYFQILLSINQ
jgi:hypothetical protein